MIKLYRYLLVLSLIILVIMGLNISNQGINSLTMKNRQSVFALNIDNEMMYIYTFGESHSTSYKEVLRLKEIIFQHIKSYWHETKIYFDHGWKILKVIV